MTASRMSLLLQIEFPLLRRYGLLVCAPFKTNSPSAHKAPQALLKLCRAFPQPIARCIHDGLLSSPGYWRTMLGGSRAGPPHRSARRASRAFGPEPATSARSRCGPRPLAVRDLRQTTTRAERPSTCSSLDVRSSRYRAVRLKTRDAPCPRRPARLRFADATVERAVSRPSPGEPVHLL